MNGMTNATSANANTTHLPMPSVQVDKPNQAMIGFGQVRHTRFPELIKIVIAESRAHPDVGQLYLDTVINQGLPLFEGLIRRGIASGEFRAVDPALTARLMIGPMLLAVIWKTVFEPIGAEALDIEAYAAQHADIFLKGILS